MQVTNNADKVHESLSAYKEEVERKLKEMVAKFAYKIAEVASSNTPIGDQASIDIGAGGKEPFKTYYDFYAGRYKEYQIPMKVGYHKGAWQHSESGDFRSFFNRRITEPSSAFNSVYNETVDSYNIGDTFYIGAIGPGFAALNGTDGSIPKSSQAPNGIMAPSISDIMVIYNSDIKHMFDNA